MVDASVTNGARTHVVRLRQYKHFCRAPVHAASAGTSNSPLGKLQGFENLKLSSRYMGVEDTVVGRKLLVLIGSSFPIY